MSKKKNNVEKFVPFTHQELDLKNALVGEARRLKDDKDFTLRLASAMIYASIAEYLAEHLLQSLRYLVYRSTYVDYAGIVFIDERGRSGGRTLGSISTEIAKFNFPDKSSVTETLRQITESRNRLFHNLAKTTIKDFPSLDKHIESIQDGTEEFIEKVNVIYSGLQKILVPQAEPPKGENGTT